MPVTPKSASNRLCYISDRNIHLPIRHLCLRLVLLPSNLPFLQAPLTLWIVIMVLTPEIWEVMLGSCISLVF